MIGAVLRLGYPQNPMVHHKFPDQNDYDVMLYIHWVPSPHLKTLVPAHLYVLLPLGPRHLHQNHQRVHLFDLRELHGNPPW
jgi:hypothetical protein